MRLRLALVFAAIITVALARPGPAAMLAADDPTPPDQVVKLIFIHHSTGENWLTDDYGNLGRALGQNNYFVSDTNYGWGPNAIGDRTDIPDWMEWFRSADTPTYMAALFTESQKHSTYERALPNPGGENEIVMFKSCFPNSALEGQPGDPPDPAPGLTVGHAKYVYNGILQYFATRQDKLFVVVTAPPLSDPALAANARAFNNWLVYNWLWENGYASGNVAVFDFYNVLTHADYHHRFFNGEVQHLFGSHNTLYYPSGDDHPSVAGSRKATNEFVPLLNVSYHRWKAGARSVAVTSDGAQDGWVLESAENSGRGGSLNRTGTTIRVGDDARNRQYRAILSFDTSVLPDDAVIVSALLKIRRSAAVGTEPFKTHGALLADLRTGGFGADPALQLSDFQAAPTKAGAASFNKTAVMQWNNAVLKSADFPAINLTGRTQVRLRHGLGDDNDLKADYRTFSSGDSAFKPAWWISYYTPGP